MHVRSGSMDSNVGDRLGVLEDAIDPHRCLLGGGGFEHFSNLLTEVAERHQVGFNRPGGLLHLRSVEELLESGEVKGFLAVHHVEAVGQVLGQLEGKICVMREVHLTPYQHLLSCKLLYTQRTLQSTRVFRRKRDLKMCATGLVTFMFVDIESSTQLVERIDGDFADVLDDFYGLVRAEAEARQGSIVETDGDGVFAAFVDPAGALEAAVDIQRRLGKDPVAHGIQLKARIGLHVGKAVAASGSYVGREVHRAARISDAGHGGQIVLSAAIEDLLGDVLLCRQWQTRDLGTYLLKGLTRPERLLQVEAPGLATDFPGLRANPVMTDAELTSYTHLL